MAEIQTFTNGDAVSKLLQLHARQLNVYQAIRWTGRGSDDVVLVMMELSNKKLLSECLWNGQRELMSIPEIQEIPEALRAKIAAIILQSHAIFELEMKKPK